MNDDFELDDDDEVLSSVQFPVETQEENFTINTSAESILQKCGHAKKLKQLENSEKFPDDLLQNPSQIVPIKRVIQDCSTNETKKIKKQSSFLDNCSPVKRLFPGPAGILSTFNDTEEKDNFFCTQTTFSAFQNGKWPEMYKDFTLGSSAHLIDRFNIEWIKKQISLNMFVNQKAPFLAGVILSLEVVIQKKTVIVTLRDLTGTIQGMVEHNLYDEYSTYFSLGSVIVITNFTVLSCNCNKCDNYHLTITKKNLCAIYSNRKLVLQKIDPHQLITQYYKKMNEEKSKITTKENITKNTCNESTQNSTVLYNSKDKNTSPNVKYRFDKNTSVQVHASRKYTFKSISNDCQPIELLSNNQDFNNQQNHPKILKENTVGTDLTESKASDSECEDSIVKLGDTQMSIRVQKPEEKEIWKDVFEGIDMQSFLEDI